MGSSDTRRILLAAASLTVLQVLAPVAIAQDARKVTVAMLMTGTLTADDDALAERFISAMRALGWVEKKNIVYERFSTGGSRAAARELARAVVKSNPDLIYAPTGGATGAAMKATQSIPIVFVTVSDPVAGGFVSSLARPGGNVTGVMQMGGEITSKRLELVREVLPRTKRIGVLLDTRASDYVFQRRQFEETLKPKGLSIVTADIATFEEVPAAVAQLKKRGASVLMTMPSFTLSARRNDLVSLAFSSGMPIVSYRQEWADGGALLSYGADQSEVYRRSAEIANRLLRGSRAADTPVERASKFEMVVNLRTARKLGIEVPAALLLRADRVIE